MIQSRVEPTIITLGLGRGSRLLDELIRERLVVEKGPRIIELVVPGSLEVLHGRNHGIHLFISDEGQQRGRDTFGGIGIR